MNIYIYSGGRCAKPRWLWPWMRVACMDTVATAKAEGDLLGAEHGCSDGTGSRQSVGHEGAGGGAMAKGRAHGERPRQDGGRAAEVPHSQLGMHTRSLSVLGIMRP